MVVASNCERMAETHGHWQMHLISAGEHRQAGSQWSWLRGAARSRDALPQRRQLDACGRIRRDREREADDRPKLAAALAHAKAIGATVVFAKLDRLTRSVDLLRTLVASGVDLVFCDLPNVPPGAMGRFLLTQMASVAELEAGLISERTKVALAAAKARGVKLGNPNGARALRGKQVGNAEAVEAIKQKADAHAINLRAIVADIRGQGITSVRKMADELNRRGILTPRGGEWQPTTVVRLLARLSG